MYSVPKRCQFALARARARPTWVPQRIHTSGHVKPYGPMVQTQAGPIQGTIDMIHILTLHDADVDAPTLQIHNCTRPAKSYAACLGTHVRKLFKEYIATYFSRIEFKAPTWLPMYGSRIRSQSGSRMCLHGSHLARRPCIQSLVPRWFPNATNSLWHLPISNFRILCRFRKVQYLSSAWLCLTFLRQTQGNNAVGRKLLGHLYCARLLNPYSILSTVGSFWVSSIHMVSA